MLLEVLDLTLHVKCKEGYEISTRLLAQILILYSSTYPIDYRSSTISYDSITESLPLRVCILASGSRLSWNKLLNASLFLGMG